MFDDDAKLPCYNGRVISWLISSEGSVAGSDTTRSQVSMNNSELVIGGGGAGVIANLSNGHTSTNINSIISSIANSTELNSTANDHIENGRAAINSIDINNHHHHHHVEQQYQRKSTRLIQRDSEYNNENDSQTECESSVVSSMHELKLHRSSSRRHYNSFSMFQVNYEEDNNLINFIHLI